LAIAGGWLLFIVFIMSFGRELSSVFGRPTGTAPLGGVRLIFVVWFAISIATFVLIWLGGFQSDDRIVLAVVFAILTLLAILDRALGRKGAR
jgi:hypothetical protein